jgi:uncharacterized protein (TIGR02145 family)
MKSLKLLLSSLALLLSVTVVLLGCDGDKGTGGGGGGGSGNSTVGNNQCGVDGTDKSCKTVKIGEQTWMAENLNYQTGNSWCYEDSNSYCNKYGRLYDWETAKNACPSGWRLPDTADWNKLVNTVGGWEFAGRKLKSTSESGYGTDAFGFSALLGGRGDRPYSSAVFYSAGIYGYWWTATEESDGNAYVRSIGFNDDHLYERLNDKSVWISVRCLKTD